jgi:hypothetical protein
MRMRAAVLSGVITAAMVAGVCFSQETSQNHTSDSTQLLAQLRSNDLRTRRGAFGQVRSNPAMLRDPNVQSALLDFLDEESRGFEAAVRKGEATRAAHEKDDSPGPYDDYGFFGNDVLSLIETFVDWHDPHQICVLAKAGAALDSPDAPESATRAQVALPCLQQLLKSDLFMDRSNAVRISVALLAGAKSRLDSATAEAMRQMVILALHDQRVEVRWEAVGSLERDGRPDMIPALKELAESSPGPNATKDEIAIRKNAAKAISAIQQREGHD